jgi:hypothetical protein
VEWENKKQDYYTRLLRIWEININVPHSVPGDIAGVGIAVGVTVTAGVIWLADKVFDSFSKKNNEAEHKKNARQSTKNKHEEGLSRKIKDKGGEKGDARRKKHK